MEGFGKSDIVSASLTNLQETLEMTSIATAQNPASIAPAELEALRATLSVVKDGRSWTVRDAQGEILATKNKKSAADQFVQNYLPPFTIETSDTQPQETTMTEPQETPTEVNPATGLEADIKIEATAEVTEPAPATEPTEPTEPTKETEVTKEEVQLSPEEQAAFDKKQARSQKLREAMAKVLAAPYDPNATHPSFKTKRGLHVQLEGGDIQESLPAVLHHRAISSFSDKSLVDGVTYMGKPVPAARTRGTWRGVKTSFLWIEAPRLSFPASMVGGSSRDTVTFHILIDNEDWDNLEGAAVTADFPADEPTKSADSAKKAPWDKPTPTDSDEDSGETDEDTPTPAKREPKPQADSAQA